MSIDRQVTGSSGRACVLLTGATGFLGRELLWLLLRELPADMDILCLVRPESRHDVDDRKHLQPGLGSLAEQAQHRLSKLLAVSTLSDLAKDDPRRQRVSVQLGDVTQPRLGLSPDEFAALAMRVTEIYHGAAAVRFDAPLQQARRTNVEGTQTMLDLAAAAHAAGHLRRFHYIGTAFVAGIKTGLVLEDELSLAISAKGDADAAFHNTYEQTKYEAEAAVRKQLAAGLPVSIYRPSIIVGDSQSGYTSSFKVMYWPLKIFARGLIPIVPAARAGIVDLVPVDFVVKAIFALGSQKDSLGRCYHLAAGIEHSTTIGQAVDIAAAFFNVYKPLFIPRQTFERYFRKVLNLVLRGKGRQALEIGRVYIPYLNYQAHFDTTNARRDLRASGLSVPNVPNYFQTLLRYCVTSNWGKRDIA